MDEFSPICQSAKNFATLMLSGQKLTKYGSLYLDINGLLPSGFLTYIRRVRNNFGDFLLLIRFLKSGGAQFEVILRS